MDIFNVELPPDSSWNWESTTTISPAIAYITHDVCAKCHSRGKAKFDSNCEVHYGNIVTSICGLCKQQIADETLALRLENEALKEMLTNREQETQQKCLDDVISWTLHVNSQWDFLQCIEFLKKEWGDKMEIKSSSEFLARLGMDGRLWAEEFCKRFPQCNVDDVLGWCCNMIMAGYDKGLLKRNGRQLNEQRR